MSIFYVGTGTICSTNAYAVLSVMWYVFTRIDNKYTWPTGRQHIHRNARSLKAEHPRSTGDPHSVVLVVRPSGTHYCCGSGLSWRLLIS